MTRRSQDIPWIPDDHSQLGGIGSLSHPELEQLIDLLVARVSSLEGQLAVAQQARPQRFYEPSMPAGVVEIDLSTQGVSYTPGMNMLLVYGNDVKQIIGVNFVEIDETTVGLTDPTVGGESIEIYVLPVPFPGP